MQKRFTNTAKRATMHPCVFHFSFAIMSFSRKIYLYSGTCAIISASLPWGISDSAAQDSYGQEARRPAYSAADHTQPPALPEDFIRDYRDYPDETRANETSPQRQINANHDAPASRIEKLYSGRAGEDLTQYGYDLFSGAQSTENSSAMPMGAVQDDFILNIGDSLNITLTGQRSESITAKIDTQGLLLIKDMPPIAAVGLSMAQLRERLERFAESSHNTKIFVTLTSVQQIGVLLIGNVEKPGRYNLTVFNSVIEALEAAGGVRKDGSLRKLKLVRGGHSEAIDLYSLLMRGGAATDLRLQDGDRIIVPPIGATIAISGAVKQPGIYELPFAASIKDGASYSLKDVLDYAGGILATGNNRFLKLGMNPDGREITQEISNHTLPLFKDGDVLMVGRTQEKREGWVELIGNTRGAGLHDAKRKSTLSKLLDADAILGDDIYPLLGIIERIDKDQLAPKFISFPIRSVLIKDYDQNILEGDKVYLFSNAQVKSYFIDNKNETGSFEKADDIEKIRPEILNFMKEQSVAIRGGVRVAGLYPVAENTTLENLIAVAGGLERGANTHNIEITSAPSQGRNPDHGSPAPLQRETYNLNETSPAMIPVQAGDAVRINVNNSAHRIEDKTVIISGEVNSPGKYDLMAGDRLSDLIARAGGLSPQSYPAGAIFSRESERRAEESRFRAAAKELERSLAAAMQKDTKAPDATQIEMVRGLAQELSTVEALGRITVEADPAILATKPELDMLLEEGDRLYIPKRPLTVRVSGEILSPASLQFRKDKDPRAYIDEAGGFTFYADKGRSFVLYPDGSAQPLKVSAWNHTPIFIPPGSTIVVPRDPKPFDFIESARDFTQILSNLAVTSIFIDDLKD